MKLNWFKKIGWIYFPVSIPGWLIAIFTLILIVHDFLAVDKHSHSVSDTYSGFIPFCGLYFIAYMWIASNTSNKPS
jgi:hypothetical protein